MIIGRLSLYFSIMNLSYWEYRSWFSNIDFTIVGSGIVGLNCALALRERYPDSKILVLEKGVLPQGASTKNAGFACFGSVSELLADLEVHSEEETVQLVRKRYQGIALLRTTLGDAAIDYQNHGGHELFLEKDEGLYSRCFNELDRINTLLSPIFGTGPFEIRKNGFGFQGIREKCITHRFEGQIDTGKMMAQLLLKVQQRNIAMLNATEVTSFEDYGDRVSVRTTTLQFETGYLFVTTNGFAAQLLGEAVRPARAQVLITEPIKNLHLKGTFHFDEGYYYFRNIDDRILFGGGRNLDFEGEETTTFGQTKRIQDQLNALLHEVILPRTPFKVDRRWSGIMGVGQQKKPIVKQISNRVFCGVRLGGMGIAIGSLVGKELADLA